VKMSNKALDQTPKRGLFSNLDDYEQQVLGGILSEKVDIDRVRSQLNNSKNFYSTKHQLMLSQRFRKRLHIHP